MKIETTKVENVDDVKDFFKELFDKGLNYHPDNDFGDYVTKDGERCFTDEEAERLDELMNESFRLCKEQDVDIYGIGLDDMLNFVNFAWVELFEEFWQIDEVGGKFGYVDTKTKEVFVFDFVQNGVLDNGEQDYIIVTRENKLHIFATHDEYRGEYPTQQYFIGYNEPMINEFIKELKD